MDPKDRIYSMTFELVMADVLQWVKREWEA